MLSPMESPDATDLAVLNRMRQLLHLRKVYYQGEGLLNAIKLLQALPDLQCLGLCNTSGPQLSIQDSLKLSQALLPLTGLTSLEMTQAKAAGVFMHVYD